MPERFKFKNNIPYLSYKSRKYVYFTYQNSDGKWEPAFPVGKGQNPVIVFDTNDTPYLFWTKFGVLTSILYFSKYVGGNLLWDYPTPLYPDTTIPLPDPYTEVYNPDVEIDENNTVHLVFEYQNMGDPIRSGILYATFPADNPPPYPQLQVEFIDQSDVYKSLKTPSLELDENGNPHVVYEKNNVIYYAEKISGIWMITPISDVGASKPSMDILSYNQGLIQVAWEQGETYPDIFYTMRKLPTGVWKNPEPIYISYNRESLYPFVKNGFLTWTEQEFYPPIDPYMEIYCARFDAVSLTWEVIGNISNTRMDSRFSQHFYYPGFPLPYLYVVWNERDFYAYTIKYQKYNFLPPPRFYVSAGDSEPSPYCVQREGFIQWDTIPEKKIDYHPEKLIYHFEGFKPSAKYKFKIVFYFKEGDTPGKWKIKINFDGKKKRNVNINPDEIKTVEGIVPPPVYEDGEIYLDIIKRKGDYALVSQIFIYEYESTSQKFTQAIRKNKNLDRLFSESPILLLKEPKILYSLEKSSFVKIEIFDIQGRLRERIFEKYKNPGIYEFIFPKEFPKGIYLYKINTKNSIRKGKIVKIK